MRCLKNGVLLAIPLASALAVGAAPRPNLAGSLCRNAETVPGKECIGRRDKKEGAVPGSRLSRDLQRHFDGRESFHLTLDGDGAVKPIASHGPLTISARCVTEVFDPDFLDPDTQTFGLTVDRIELIASSSAAPWFEANPDAEQGGGAAIPRNELAAGQKVIPLRASARSGSPYLDDGADEEIVMIGPGGYAVTMDGNALALGLNVFGHDCTLAGTLYKLKGPGTGP